MIRPFLAPRWLAWHALLVVTLVAFVLFGRWQLAAFDTARVAAPSAERVSLGQLVEPGKRLPHDVVGRAVAVRGRYDVPRQLLVPDREHDGRSGFLVVTPLVTRDGVVVVNRGWVAQNPRTDATADSVEVTVHGVVQASEPEHEARVDLVSPLPRGQIPYVSTVQLLDALPYDTRKLYDGYVLLESQRPQSATADAVTPQPVPPRETTSATGRWRNLAYALQWWLFAAGAVFLWGFVIRRARQEGRVDA